MANIKSAKKRIHVTKVKTLRNKMAKSALKTVIKKFEVAIASNNVDLAKEAFKVASRCLDMSCSKGIIHKNMASRKKSRMAVRLNSLSA